MRKIISRILILAIMLMCLQTAPIQAKDTVVITTSVGWLESAYAEWTPIDGADSYNVYSKKSDGNYVKLDDPLVREYPTYFRADALGLAAGEYTLKIVPVKNGSEMSESAVETEPLTVMAYDRTGFAFSSHSPNKTASGAYNDDGTLRSDADVLYITNGNKDTVMLNDDETTGVGLTAILAYRQSKKIKTPLAVRIIGKVEDPKNLERHTIHFQDTSNVTLEGVGDDAVAFGWLICLKRVNNMEVRNIGTMYAGEGAEASSVEMDTDNFNVWVHNCDFFYNAPGKDADQPKGDGAVAFKSRSSYMTVSYNHMWDLSKNFVSGGPWENSNMYDERAHYYATYHHNWFDHSDARMPRCVVGDNHVYNNYYDGCSMYGIGAAMKTSVFSEANYYRNVPRPIIIASQGSDVYDSTTGKYQDKGTLSGQMGGMVKSYGDVFITPSQNWWPYGQEKDEGEFDVYIAKERSEQVPDTVHAKKGDDKGYGIYNNFDTNSAVMYEYNVDTAEEAVENVKKYAGRVEGGDFEYTFNNAVDDSDHSVNQAMLEKVTNYTSKLISVGGGISLNTPEPDPSETSEPTPTLGPMPTPSGDIKAMPIGAKSYAKDWFNGQSMAAGDVSADGYVGCYKGTGNSYKSNKFTVNDVTITRGYQTKQVDSRSFYIMPESECLVTVYFYSSGTNSLGLYTTNLSAPAAAFRPESGGDYAFTYHFTDVGSPIYIAGPSGDINLAGIEISEAEPHEYKYAYEIENAEFGEDGKLNVNIKQNDNTVSGTLIVAAYTGENELTDAKHFEAKAGMNGLEFEKPSDGYIKLFIWSSLDDIKPLSAAKTITDI